MSAEHGTAEVSEDGTLGSVDFAEEFDPHLARSARVGGVLYSISPEVILSHELQSPENKIGEVPA